MSTYRLNDYLEDLQRICDDLKHKYGQASDEVVKKDLVRFIKSLENKIIQLRKMYSDLGFVPKE